MNRVIKTALAVATFGLAAALSIPAQAQIAPAGEPLDGLGQIPTGGLTPLRGAPVGGDSAGAALSGLTSALAVLTGSVGGASPLANLVGGGSPLGNLGGPLSGATPLGAVGGGTHGLRTQDVSSPAVDKAGRLNDTGTSGLVGTSPVGGVLGGVTSALPVSTSGIAELPGRHADKAGKAHMSGTARAGEPIPLVGQVAQLGTGPIMGFMHGGPIGGTTIDEIAPLVERTVDTVSADGIQSPGSLGDTLGPVTDLAAH